MNIAQGINNKTKELYTFKSSDGEKEGWYRELNSANRIGIVATAQVLISLRVTGFDLGKLYTALDTLAQFARDDGSFPFITNVNDVGVVDATGWACLAFSLCSSSHVSYEDVISKAMVWLVSVQNNDGGWGATFENPSRVVSTSVALRAILAVKNKSEALDKAFQKGLKFIVSNVSASGAWKNQAGEECLAATAYALIFLSETDRRDSELTKRATSYSLQKLSKINFWDSNLNVDQVPMMVNGQHRRSVFYYPLTHLLMRAILACGFSKELSNGVISDYLRRVLAGQTFHGDLTDYKSPTSYGFHDTIMALHQISSNNQYVPETQDEFLGCDSIDPTKYPQIYKVGGDLNSSIDVIFVHGLGGDARSTWLNKDTGYFLPKAISEMKNVRVFTVGYSNPAERTSGKGMSLQDRTDNLLNLLETYNLFNKKTIFIGHSFGGLIIKRLLISLRIKNDSRRFESVSGVIFIATPHSGSWLANILYFVQLWRGPYAVRDLFYDNKALVNLHRDYCSVVSKNSLFHRSFGENSNFTVVNAKSSNPNITTCQHVLLDASHISICKPLDGNSAMVRSLYDFISEIENA